MPPSPARPLRILIADSSRETTSQLSEYLRGLGHHVTIVETAEEALFEVVLAPANVVLMDVRLPGIEEDLLRRIFCRSGMEGALRIAVSEKQDGTSNDPAPVYWHLRLSRPIDASLLEHLLKVKRSQMD